MQEGRNADLTLEAELPAQGDGPSAPVVEVETKVAAVQVNGRIVLDEAVRDVECFRTKLHPLRFTKLE